MSSRRDFLRALASGTGAILIGNNWYKQAKLIVSIDSVYTGIRYAGIVDNSFSVSIHILSTRWNKEDLYKALYKNDPTKWPAW